MNNRIAGSILLGMSGLILTLGVVGNQIALALVQAGFYAGRLTGQTPPGPEEAGIHWIVIIATVSLALSGLYFLFRPDKLD
jgi:hypothetical protein